MALQSCLKDTGEPRRLHLAFAIFCPGEALNLKGSGYPTRGTRTTTGCLDQEGIEQLFRLDLFCKLQVGSSRC